jgi:tRNA threonylcarbamoyladenosine biosynthesis protein TsaB
MRILALETVTRRGSVALWDDGAVHARAGDDARTHGARLPGEILTLLADEGRSLADIDLFAVVSGPGSFTGLRVGIASIQGLALAGHRRVVPIPTLEAMAESWRTLNGQQTTGIRHQATDKRPHLGTREPTVVVPCLDGQRGDVFFGAWEMIGDVPVEESREIIAAGVAKPEELVDRLKGIASRSLVLVGDGALRHPEAFVGLGADVWQPPNTLAEMAARMAARRTASAVSPHALRPLYIRRPDAELARERAGFI